MPQQHVQFEEEFRNGPQPHVSYQDAPSASYTAPVPPSMQSYASRPDQPPLAHSQNAAEPRSGGYGARATLAIFSLFFIFAMFIVAQIMANMETNPGPFQSTPDTPYVFAGIFAVIVLLINLIVNRRR